ncbi:PCI domain-containing protein 2 [Gracilariopsis chorda]|uniref:PCI domain-containing protein 2 n=1 Tax=Gracilariopsis chorda TaxID=448386 RepID=A0A2V3IRD8_9FLOR|nr:PCI domain-containing protein 2 [Gracilariopsis chorda]|eukprot:PXF43720.1 PCI domain-containing protein 2 [Gracilariopsis chorda]
MSSLSQYNIDIEDAVRQKNSDALQDLLRMSSSHATAAMEQYVLQGGNVPKRLDDPWERLPEIVQKRFVTGAALNANNWVAAFDSLAEMVSQLASVVQYETAWCIPAFVTLCVDLRVVAEEADRQLVASKKKAAKLEAAERVLKKGFALTNNDRTAIEDGSKKIGTLGIVNQLLKIYFKLNNLRLCGNLTNSVNLRSAEYFESFPISHRATYRYYTGRLKLYEDKYGEAVKDLEFANENLPQHLELNKRHIMLFLIPAKILTGTLPSERMLHTLNMVWFMDIVKAIRSGNMGLFNKAVEEHEEFFIRKALYLAVEKMRPLVFRSLCKRVADMWMSNKIPLRCVERSLKVCGVGMEADEVECMLANLIFNGYIKGYISHKVGYLVLSKKKPFPNISERSKSIIKR